MKRISLIAACVAAVLCPAAYAQTVTLRLISHAYNNPNQAVSGGRPQISADGHTVAFSTTAQGIVDPALHGFSGSEVFAYDVPCQQAEIISTTWNGATADDASGAGVDPHIGVSGDGRYIAFTSEARNLVFNEPPAPPIRYDSSNVFLVDRNKAVGDTGRVKRISRAPNGDYANGYSMQPSISADGRYVAFMSYASNLVANDPNGSQGDIFIYTIATGNIALATYDATGGGANFASDYPRINADGSRVVFRSGANDLITDPVNYFSGPHTYVTNTLSGGNLLIDRNAAGDIATSGSLWSAISGNGNVVAFTSQAPNLWPSMAPPTQVFVRNITANTLQMVSLNSGNGPGPVQSDDPSLNYDGNYVAFQSAKHPWVSGDPWHGVYRRKLDDGSLLLLSPGLYGQPANNTSTMPSISGDAVRTAFLSTATNLIDGVTYSGNPVYLAHVGAPSVRRCTRF